MMMMIVVVVVVVIPIIMILSILPALLPLSFPQSTELIMSLCESLNHCQYVILMVIMVKMASLVRALG